MTTGNKIISFKGGTGGQWNITSMNTLAGIPLEKAQKLHITTNGHADISTPATWTLKAFISNLRYTTRAEKTDLDKRNRGLGLPEYNCSALIPIKKSDEWWLLTQDERRKIFEEDSRHIQISAGYLSAISRQLHHCRDLGEAFDFITWFEFSSEHIDQFNELTERLRKTEEWKYVVREIDIRLERAPFE